MRVVPLVGRKGDVICLIDHLIGLFDRDKPVPAPGIEIEVMACTVVTPRRIEPEADLPQIKIVLVRPVTDDDVLIDHEGFECAGTMCRTTARVTQESDARLEQLCGHGLGWITPGRTPVDEVSNVNARFDRREPYPLRPGQAYVSQSEVMQGLHRITGVPHLALLDGHVLSRMNLW